MSESVELRRKLDYFEFDEIQVTRGKYAGRRGIILQIEPDKRKCYLMYHCQLEDGESVRVVSSQMRLIRHAEN